ncbi:MAG: aromatic amino acid lyase, partial [Actinomycetota bacterium]
MAALARFARPVPDDVPGPGIDAGALRRVAQAHATALHVAATGPVYGQTTGVGANRAVTVPRADADGHALRLLRSHAG